MMYLTVDSTNFSAGWSIVKLILVLILVLILAFYATKYIAKFQNNSLVGKSNIRFIDSYRVGGNKLISIVQIAGKFYAIGIGKDEIHLIDKLDQEDIVFPDNMKQSMEDKIDDVQGQGAGKISFKEVLTKVKNNNSKNHSEE